MTVKRSFHHPGYTHLKYRQSIYWLDGFYVPQWFHVPILHRLLGWGDRAGSQRLGRFPNVFQRAAHWGLRAIALLTMPFDAIVPVYARLGAVVFWVMVAAIGRSFWVEIQAVVLAFLV
jgi:hypothetical protein